MITPEIRIKVIKKLAELDLKKKRLKEIRAPFETQMAAIEKALTEATADDATAIEALEEELKTLALSHGLEIFGKDSKSLPNGNLTLAVRDVEKVEFIGDEEELIAQLERAAKDSDDAATRIAAAACIRTTKALNKPFIREHWDTFQPWFAMFGIHLAEHQSASITERKPAKPKAAKPLKKSKTPASDAAA